METDTAKRIRSRWGLASSPRNITDGSITINTQGGNSNSWGGNTYSGSAVTNISSDFLGDWRSADSWQRFDIFRVRNRSRQLERGNPWCIGYGRNMVNNVLGASGFRFKVQAATSKVFGDSTEGQQDAGANVMIQMAMDEQGLSRNFETRKRMSREDFDELLLRRLIFDGEVIIRKMRGFANDCGFAWQMIDPDYLDQNLNRIEPNGNIIKMSVELDAQFKFPVAYWFLQRRPNDYFYNYNQFDQQRYFRVPAEEIIHIYMQDADSEQTRGWPWVFSSVVNLHRMGKFEEAALVNAAIGASRGIYFKKDYPTGFDGTGSLPDDNGNLSQVIPAGSAMELPYGVTPVVADMRYPDAEFESFRNAMMLGASMSFGTSYSTTTGDLSKANFVSSRMGQLEEREFFKRIQQILIRRWKIPGFDEELYRAMLSQRVPLPLSKFSKFNKPQFRGRRWPFVQPVDDMKAIEMKLNNRLTSVTMVIEEFTEDDPDEVLASIIAWEQKAKAGGVERILATPPAAVTESDEGAGKPAPGTPEKTTATKKD